MKCEKCTRVKRLAKAIEKRECERQMCECDDMTSRNGGQKTKPKDKGRLKTEKHRKTEKMEW